MQGCIVKAATGMEKGCIRYTLRHEAETCLFIKEMGPLGFSVNAIDPMLVLNH